MDDIKPAIEVKNITKSFRIPLDKGRNLKQKILGRSSKGYRIFTPLNDISFTVNEGDFFGIVGRNGSGKSTLLKTIAGIYTPQQGKVTVNGILVPFIELGVGFNPELSGRENVYLNAALLGFSRGEIDGMYDDIVDFAELHDFMEERLQNYSSGMQVRLAFSIAIRAQGDVLLLDEVLAVGDSAFQQKCYDYFEELKRNNKTVILVTHSMTNVERFCNRALLLDEGRIAHIGDSKEVAIRYTELFLDNPKNTNTDNQAKDTKKVIHGSLTKHKVEAHVYLDQKKSMSDAKYTHKDESVSLIIEINSSVSIKDVSVGVVVRRMGVPVFATNTKVDNLSISLGKNATNIAMDIDNIFANGDHIVSVGVRLPDGNLIFANDEAATFRVAGRKHEYAIVSPKFSMKLLE